MGKWIDVDGHQFEVIGAMERPAASFPGSQDLRILLPYFTMQKLFPSERENMLIVIARRLFFGIWPATPAARLDPVVALRYE